MEPTAAVYAELLADLLRPWEKREAMGNALLLPEAREVVRSLDRIWAAVQEFQGGGPDWPAHPFGREPEDTERSGAASGGE
jgi:hypothetical protein